MDTTKIKQVVVQASENSRTHLLETSSDEDREELLRRPAVVELNAGFLKKRVGTARFARLQAQKTGPEPKKRYVEPRGYVKMLDGAFFADSPQRLRSTLEGSPAGQIGDELEGLGVAGFDPDIENWKTTRPRTRPIVGDTELNGTGYWGDPPSPHFPDDLRNLVQAAELSKLDLFKHDLSAGPGRELNSWRYLFTAMGFLLFINRVKYKMKYRLAVLQWKLQSLKNAFVYRLRPIQHQLMLARRMGLRRYVRMLKVKYVRPAPLREVSWAAAEPLRRTDGSYFACLQESEHKFLVLPGGEYGLDDLIAEGERQGVPLPKILGTYMHFTHLANAMYKDLRRCDNCSTGTVSCTDPNGYVPGRWAETAHQVEYRSKVAAAMWANPDLKFSHREWVPGVPEEGEPSAWEEARRFGAQPSYFMLHFDCLKCGKTGIKPNAPTYGDVSQLIAVRMGLSKSVRFSENMKAAIFPATEAEVVAAYLGVMARSYRLKPEPPEALLASVDQWKINQLSPKEFSKLLDDVNAELARRAAELQDLE